MFFVDVFSKYISNVIFYNQLKRLMKALSFYTLLILVGSYLSSCSEDDLAVDASTSASQSPSSHKIMVSEGMLVFDTRESFDTTLQELTKISQEELETWNYKFENYTSMQNIYNSALLDQQAFVERTSSILDQEGNTNSEQMYSAYVLNVKESLVFNEDGSFFPDVPTPELAYIVNSKGQVRIGNDIVQYSSEKINITYQVGSDREHSRVTEVDHKEVSSIEADPINARSITKEYYQGGRRINGSVSVSTYNVPVLVEDDNGDCSQFGECEYEDNYTSTYKVFLENQLCARWIAVCVWVLSKVDRLSITASFSADGIPQGPFTVSGNNAADIKRTLYFKDGLSRSESVEYTNASNKFYAKHNSQSTTAYINF